MLILQGEIKKNIMIWIKAGKKLQKDNWQGICSTTGEWRLHKIASVW